MKFFLFTIFSCVFFSFSLLQFNWGIASDYSIKFSGKNAEGTFQGLSGTIVFDEKEPTKSKFDVVVKANTIKTGNDTKDKHARGDSWFDVEKYPDIRFASSSFEKVGAGFLVKGKLTLHGTTKDVAIPFTFKKDGSNGLFEGRFIVNRSEYGIEGNFFGFSVGEAFTIDLRVPVKPL